MSDIRVSVQWESSSVFAGEDLECIITFKNIAQAEHGPKSPLPSSQLRVTSSGRERWKESLSQHNAPIAVGHTRNSSLSHTALSKAQAISTSHKPAVSLNAPVSTRQDSAVNSDQSSSHVVSASCGKHGRSVSIVSIGGDSTARRPARYHNRTASLQVLPLRDVNGYSGPTSAPVNGRTTSFPSPLLKESSSSIRNRSPSPNKSNVSSSGAAVSRSATGPRYPRKASNSISSNFKFPTVFEPPNESARERSNEASITGNPPPIAPRMHEGIKVMDSVNPGTRVLSDASVSGTPRSSADFYSMSNNSTETLASEYATHDKARLPLSSMHSRQTSLLNPNKLPKAPDVLMMGYGHITGSFTLDSSLINHSPFEDVKRKGIIGDQGGGGVVREEKSKRDSGIFGFSGWGNIGESLGGLLGGTELSSIKETKVSSNAKSIPILSTPQSILFVDLQLRPGESRSYRYRQPLPRGIPPSHRGRAMKVTYNLVVGTQRATKATSQLNVRHVDIPFRVLPSVNGRGDVLGHDLMLPHIILNSNACVTSITESHHHSPFALNTPASGQHDDSSQGFLSYVESMLERRRQSSGLGLLSPTEGGYRSLTPTAEDETSMKEAVELAILQSTATTPGRKSANRFEITRNGHRVAVIMLVRPAYRLGEAIPVAIVFDDAEIPCYSVLVTLESHETIDAAIALRSKASIQRVTRRVHASRTESAIYSRRVTFNLVIPMNATPGFLTSGVSHEWRLKVEFVTRRTKSEEDTDSSDEDLLEEITRDERGSVMAGVQSIACEAFEITVPLQIYGATSAFDQLQETDDFQI